MGNRTGTYVMFAAEGNTDPTVTDMKYYRTLEMWHEHEHIEFSMTNSHDKTGAVRDTSKKETLRRALMERLNCSKNAILIVGQNTRFDTDWVPFEIEYAIDVCKIPIIVAYPSAGEFVLNASPFKPLWPQVLTQRIENETARTIHVPFRKDPIKAAIAGYAHDKMPEWVVTIWTAETYRKWGVLAA